MNSLTGYTIRLRTYQRARDFSPTIVPEAPGHELLSTEDDISLSSFTTNDRIVPELSRERCDKVKTFIVNRESYLSAGKESDKRCKRKKGADSDLSQNRSRESPAEEHLADRIEFEN